MGRGQCDRGRYEDGDMFRREWLGMDSKHARMDGDRGGKSSRIEVSSRNGARLCIIYQNDNEKDNAIAGLSLSLSLSLSISFPLCMPVRVCVTLWLRNIIVVKLVEMPSNIRPKFA